MQGFATVGEVARRLSGVTNIEEGVIARQLRGWIQTGALRPTLQEARGASGSIKAALFDFEGICSARLLMALVAASTMKTIEDELGEGASDIAKRVLSQSEDERTEVHAVGGQSHYSLSEAVSDTINNRDASWVLEIAMVRDFEERSVKPSTHWIKNGKRPHIIPNWLSDHIPASGLQVEAVIQVPFSQFVRSLRAD